MGKAARNRRIKYWTKGNRSWSRRVRRVFRWNGKMPGWGAKSKNPIDYGEFR